MRDTPLLLAVMCLAFLLNLLLDVINVSSGSATPDFQLIDLFQRYLLGINECQLLGNLRMAFLGCTARRFYHRVLGGQFVGAVLNDIRHGIERSRHHTNFITRRG